MAKLTEQEIEQLQQQLKEKLNEAKDIYDKLMEAGAVELPDDILDVVAGGLHPVEPTVVHQSSSSSSTQTRK